MAFFELEAHVGSGSAYGQLGDLLRIGGGDEVDVVTVPSNYGSRVHSFLRLAAFLVQVVGSDGV